MALWCAFADLSQEARAGRVASLAAAGSASLLQQRNTVSYVICAPGLSCRSRTYSDIQLALNLGSRDGVSGTRTGNSSEQ